MRPLPVFAILSLLFTSFFMTSCYKDDLNEFKEAKSLKYSPEMALPFLTADVTLDDTIPLVASYTYVSMSDTASIELPQGDEKDSLESVLEYIDFRIQLENTFPFTGEVQLYFADTAGVYIDSLLNLTERVVQSGSPTISKKELNVTVSKERYFQLTKKAEKMYLYYNVTTSDISGIEDDYLRVKIGIKAKLNVTIEN